MKFGLHQQQTKISLHSLKMKKQTKNVQQLININPITEEKQKCLIDI